MAVFQIFKKNYFKFFIITLSIVLFTSCNFSKKNDAKSVISDIDIEERSVASFLVKATEINSSIIKLSKLAEFNSKSVEVKDAFAEQIKITMTIQKKIKMISEEKFVTTPLLNSRFDIKYTNDEALLDSLLNELILEIMLFEKITDTSNDSKIFELKNEFLPKLNYQSQKISSLKIKSKITK